LNGPMRRSFFRAGLAGIALCSFGSVAWGIAAGGLWGVIPAAGLGTRIQPLAFSKELLPVGTRHDGQTERPLAVCEYLLERMLTAGATRVCFVISPAKTDIMSYFGGQIGNASICYAVQQNPNGLCDALF